MVTPSAPIQTHNEICTLALDGRSARQLVAEETAIFRTNQVPFRWVLGPRCLDAGIGKLLSGGGAICHSMVGMAVEPTRALERLARAANHAGGQGSEPPLRIVAVDASTIEDYTATLASGWSMPLEHFADDYRSMISSPAPLRSLYLAYLGDQIAGAAESSLLPGVGYLGGGLVLPPFRHRGIYRALVRARLADIAGRGLPLAVTQSRAATSAPILLAVGFQSVFGFELYDVSA